MIMKISKTIFKEYTRCPRVCALDDIYKKRMFSNASIFGDDDKKSDIIDLLQTMFDVDTGDDLIEIPDPQLDALLPYYNQLEQYAMEIAKKKFGSNIWYSLDTKKQKSFSFTDNNHHQYYCYLDGYLETDTSVTIFEVKATTSRKFMELGPTIKGRQHSIFEEMDGVIRLRKKHDIPDDKYASAYSKLFDRFSDAGKYVYDLAIERYFIENSIQNDSRMKSKTFKYYLVVLNSDYVFDGTYDESGDMVYHTDHLGRDLVVFVDLTEVTQAALSHIDIEKNKMVRFIESMDASPIMLGHYCERKKQAKCAFIQTCWEKALEKGSILEYMGHHYGFKDEYGVSHKAIELINQGHFKMDSIPKHWLQRINNQIQRDCYDYHQEYLDHDKITRGAKHIAYPIYHLDFESFPSPLPRFAHEKPYQQSVFQFSLHIEQSRGVCDKNKDHIEYLAPDHLDHREDLVKKLVESIDLSQGGTVLVYNKSFEHTRIKEFVLLYPQYKQALETINDHMFDLIDLVATNGKFYQNLGYSEEESKTINYYHTDLKGSYSIKKVLPVFSDLTYDNLEVANGTEAIAAYAMFKHLEKEDLEALRRNLIEYCKQDTWAMVLVLWGLLKKVNLL